MRRVSAQLNGLKLTGQKRVFLSPLTGKMAVYHESYHIQVTNHSTMPPDINLLKEQINADLLNQGVDAFTDEILVVQGVVQDIYKPRVWVAEEQPELEKRLIAPGIIMALIYAITIIAVAIAVVVSVYILTNTFATISEWILQPPSYVGGTTEEPTVFNNWAEYYTHQQLLYWYVCPKCGAGFGEKSKYPNIEDVPQEIVDAYNEHVKNCLGIPKGPQNVGEYLIWTVVIIGGGVAVLWLVTSLLKGGGETKIVMPPAPPIT